MSSLSSVLSSLLPALEHGSNNKEKLETEVVVYCKVSNPQGLEECDTQELHYQLESTFSNGTRCRVRKVTKDGKDQYFFTMKVKVSDKENPAVEANREYTFEVDFDFFNGFKSVAERALDKTRYIFNSKEVTLTLGGPEGNRDIVIPNIQYEVDIYKKEDGTTSEWCKIDIEIDNVINYLDSKHPEVKDFKLFVKVSHLPFQPADSILSVTANEEQKKTIEAIWKEFTQEIK